MTVWYSFRTCGSQQSCVSSPINPSGLANNYILSRGGVTPFKVDWLGTDHL